MNGAECGECGYIQCKCFEREREKERKEQQEHTKLKERITELEAALKKYGNCLDTCSFRQGLRASSLEKCDCGLEQAKKGSE